MLRLRGFALASSATCKDVQFINLVERLDLADVGSVDEKPIDIGKKAMSERTGALLKGHRGALA